MAMEDDYQPDQILTDEAEKSEDTFDCECCEKTKSVSDESAVDGLCEGCFQDSLEITNPEEEKYAN